MTINNTRLWSKSGERSLLTNCVRLPIPCTKRGTKPILVQKFLLVFRKCRRETMYNQPIHRKQSLERGRSRSFVDTKRRGATAFGCPETPFFRPQSTALHPVDLLASTWCMVPQNGHLSQLPITELTGKVNICRNKVLKHSLPSIVMSPCIRLLTRLCARRSTLRLHFWQCRQLQNP